MKDRTYMSASSKKPTKEVTSRRSKAKITSILNGLADKPLI